jgi:hypothetical protein
MNATLVSLEVEREVIDATRMPAQVPNPNWVHRDKDGREFRWQKDRRGRWCLPDLSHKVHPEVTKTCECCGATIVVSEGVDQWETPSGEVVTLGYQSAPMGITHLPGRTKWSGQLHSTRKLRLGSKHFLRNVKRVGDDVGSIDGEFVVVSVADEQSCRGGYVSEIEGVGPLSYRRLRC